jgi:hypothetical protein
MTNHEIWMHKLRLEVHSGLPTLIARSHEHLHVHISINPDLARKTELTENAIFFQASLFRLAHRRLFGMERDAARGATSVTSAPVTNIHAGFFNREGKLFACLGLKRIESFDRNLVTH